jgi:predicted ribosomally synthesized peptide with nif11-like leader
MASFSPQHLQAMSEEQLAALLAKLKDDAGLQEKLKAAADLDAALALAKEAGFDVSKADWLKYQANQTLELSDEELEGVAGGKLHVTVCVAYVILSGLSMIKFDCIN